MGYSLECRICEGRTWSDIILRGCSMLQSQPVLQTGQHCCYKVSLGVLPLSPQCATLLLLSRKKSTLMSNKYPRQGTAVLVVSCQKFVSLEQCSVCCNGQGTILKF